MQCSLSHLERSLRALLLTTALATSTLAHPPDQTAAPTSSPAAIPAPAATPAPNQEASQSNNSAASENIYAQGDTVEIAHPYNPKALGVIPPGWIPEPIPNYSVRNPNVSLNNGSTVTIDCPIYALVPDTKSQYRPFREPGFDLDKGNNQTGTLGNILTHFIALNEDLGKQIDAALVQIQNGFMATEAKADPDGDANRLLIDKPTENANSSGTPAATPDAAPSPTPAPAATPSTPATPAPTPAAKNRLKETIHAAHRKDKPKDTPSPSPTPDKKFLGIFPSIKHDTALPTDHQ
jgi:hypothetical protein